ncbi:MAG: 4-hydroxybenzoate octaprenyltransferase [Bacteroidetes bacterium]|nr:MAG: 4-hydroxybenzoate octaprenyltransferase [Bacteroidota bacterium]REK47774.1 MAG: 4-hydroxybenzoate octaprenyltransferase [Bacteroidota bacterium]
MRIKINNYLSLVKFSHTVFAMPFALIGYVYGISRSGIGFHLPLLIKVILCMVFARTAAMSFNRWADRKIDAQNDRTRVREIPSGVVSGKEALLLTAFSSLAFIVTAWFINPLCFYLSPAALLIILGYSYTKRFTWLCHLILGLGLSLAPIGAYLAVTGVFDLVPLLFSFAVLAWVGGFDIIYALQDEDFDRSRKLHSIPVLIGKKRALILSSVLHALSFLFLLYAGLESGSGNIYWAGLAIFSALLIYQHSIISPDNLKRVNMAFFTTNGIASIVFAAFVITEEILKW